MKTSLLPFKNKLVHRNNWLYAIISEKSGIGNLVFQQSSTAQDINYHDRVYIPQTEHVRISVSVCKDMMRTWGSEVILSLGVDCETKIYDDTSCLALIHNKDVFIDPDNKFYIDSDTAAMCDIMDVTQIPWKRIYYTIEY